LIGTTSLPSGEGPFTLRVRAAVDAQRLLHLRVWRGPEIAGDDEAENTEGNGADRAIDDALWAVWLVALHAWIGGGGSPLSETPARWMPDLGLVLALSLLARVEVADAPWIALVAAFTRAAFSAEPPIVLLTGFLGIVLLALVARSAVELTGPLWRALAALVLVFTFDLWLAFAHSMRLPVGSESVPFSMFAAWPAAISSVHRSRTCPA
jgi:hypothetical protein